MSEETLVVGRRQLEGTINSPDTSLQITAEQRDRRTAGRVEGADRRVLKGNGGMEGDRPGAGVRQGRDFGVGG